MRWVPLPASERYQSIGMFMYQSTLSYMLISKFCEFSLLHWPLHCSAVRKIYYTAPPQWCQITATITAIFLASFPATFMAFPHRSCCCWRFCCWGCAFSCWCPCLKLTFLLLLGSLLLPTSLLLIAFLLLLGCHKLVFGWMIHSPDGTMPFYRAQPPPTCLHNRAARINSIA